MTPADPVAWVREGALDRHAAVQTPSGPRQRIYLDHAASGVALAPVEDWIGRRVLPFYANAHSAAAASAEYMGALVGEARREIRARVNADDRYAVLFCGAGCTAAVNKLAAALAARNPGACVFHTGMEHNSNLLPWRDRFPTRRVEFGPGGQANPENLAWQLDRVTAPSIGAFSAGSNVTGKVNDVDTLAAVMHARGGLAFFDYGAAGPHVAIDMRGGTMYQKDAVYLSIHKFVGGPQAPGLLIVLRDLMPDVPLEPGGGTIAWVTPETHGYLSDVEEREQAGTPPAVGIVRAGLAFAVKQALGVAGRAVETALTDRVLAGLRAVPGVKVLGPPRAAEDLPIVSFTLHHGELHHHLAARLLSNRFGVQIRSGCMCAGIYGHHLLEIDGARVELHGRRTLPGWLRVSLSPTTTDEDVTAFLAAVRSVAENWRSWQRDYAQQDSGYWLHKAFRMATPRIAFE